MQPKCTLAPKHKWEWVKDVTLRNVSMGASGTKILLSRRGVFQCACGGTRHGIARSGL